MSKMRKGKTHSEESKRKMSESMKLLYINNPEKREIARNNLIKSNKGKSWNKGKKEPLEQKEKRIKASLKGLFKRPTSLEKQMIEIINKHNLPYKYTGDGSFLIGYKNPDFVNINGEKICIEVANTFHHKEDYPEKRKEHFAKYGWECIVFRTNKLEENEVLKMVRWLNGTIKCKRITA